MNSLFFGALSGLWPVLVVLALGALLAVAFRGAFSGISKDDKGESAAPLEVRARRYFFTQAERACYALLLEVTRDSGHTVFAKVRLNDLIEATGEARQATNNRINRQHVDFVLLSQPEFKPVMVIELDGASHESRAQQTRDAKKDAALRAAGLPLVRLPNGATREQLRGVLEPVVNLRPAAVSRRTVEKAALKN